MTTEENTVRVVVHKANVPMMSGESIQDFVKACRGSGSKHLTSKLNLTKDAYIYPVEMYADKVIFSVEDSVRGAGFTRKLYASKFTRKDNGDFDFSDTTEVRPVTSYEAVGTPGGVVPVLKEDSAVDVDVEKAVWTAAYVNTLPDSSFAYVEAGGRKDATNRTVPRSLRHFPYKDENGRVDLPHLRNALARLPQSNLSAAAKAEAKRKLDAAAKERLPSSEAAEREEREEHVQGGVKKGLFGNVL